MELIQLADGLIALHHMGEHVDDRRVLDLVKLLLLPRPNDARREPGAL